MNHFGARIREARLARGWSVRDLAIAAGVPLADIPSIEDGRTYMSNHLPVLMRTLGITTENGFVYTIDGPVKL